MFNVKWFIEIFIFIFMLYFKDFRAEVDVDLVSQINDVDTSIAFDNLDDKIYNLSRDGKNTTCSVAEWGTNSFFRYILNNLYKIKRVEILIIEQDKFKSKDGIQLDISLKSDTSGLNQSCKIVDNLEGKPWSNRRRIISRCSSDYPANEVIVTDLRGNNEFFGICEMAIFGPKPESQNGPISTSTPSDKTDFDLQYVYIGLGCLGFIIILITIICLVVKHKKRRDSMTAPYYYWSNGIDSSSGVESSPNPNPNQPGFGLPNRVHVPYPLPRDAQSREFILRHLQADRQSGADSNHYSVIQQPGFSDNPYLSILGDLPSDKNVSEPIYEECIPDELYDDCLVRPCPEIPQPPNTRFSELGTFGRRLPRGRMNDKNN